MHKRSIHNTWPAAALIVAAMGVALTVHFAQSFTGPLRVPLPADLYGNATFPTGPSAYPRNVKDTEGYPVRFQAPARRVASQYWSIDEYVYSIVPPEQIVAVSTAAYDRSFSNVYEWAERYRPAISTDPEVILKVDPDLLLVSSDARADFTNLLRSAGTPIFRMFTAFESLDQIVRTVRMIGYLTGQDGSAARVAADFEEAIARARARKPAEDPAPRILGYAGRYSYGDRTLFDDMVRTLGGINLGAANGLRGYDAISSEQIVRWNPDWIVSGAARGQSEAVRQRLLEDPAVAATAAARKGQVVVFENNIFLPLSPFSATMLDTLGEVIYQ